MIPLLAGWKLEQLPDAIALSHPSGDARVFYRERGGRPRPVGALARKIMSAWPQYDVKSVGPVERLRTAEGEAACAIALECEEGRRPVRVDLGFVITDDVFTSVAGVCRDPGLRDELAATVRELVHQDTLALGIRRRRYEYAPPAGWQPVRQGLVAEWLPPGYPDHDARIVVHPASPGRAHLDALDLYVQSAGCTEVVLGAREGGTTRLGMPFEACTVRFERDGETRSARVIMLADALYHYPLELRGGAAMNDADLSVLAGIVDSVTAFGPHADADVFTHWTE